MERLKLGTNSFMRMSNLGFDSTSIYWGSPLCVRCFCILSPHLILPQLFFETEFFLSFYRLGNGASGRFFFFMLPQITKLANRQDRLLILYLVFFPLYVTASRKNKCILRITIRHHLISQQIFIECLWGTRHLKISWVSMALSLTVLGQCYCQQ